MCSTILTIHIKPSVKRAVKIITYGVVGIFHFIKIWIYIVLFSYPVLYPVHVIGLQIKKMELELHNLQKCSILES